MDNPAVPTYTLRYMVVWLKRVVKVFPVLGSGIADLPGRFRNRFVSSPSTLLDKLSFLSQQRSFVFLLKIRPIVSFAS